MTHSPIRIGTRESELAKWQALTVQDMLADKGYSSELVFIKSEGDIDLQTPLYEMGVQGIFTKSLDIALLQKRIDIAVHSMKDVPTQMPNGIVMAAVLARGNYHDLFVVNENFTGTLWNSDKRDAGNGFYDSLKQEDNFQWQEKNPLTIATSSIRRKAQWLHRYPSHQVVNLRGNVNSRMKKLSESNWEGAIFAAAGLERINLKPASAIELDWMLPAPAQGAIMVVCNKADNITRDACRHLHHEETFTCTKIERDFLRGLMGGCSTPISALARMDKNEIFFQGNMITPDGKQKVEIETYTPLNKVEDFGYKMAKDLLTSGGDVVAEVIKNG